MIKFKYTKCNPDGSREYYLAAAKDENSPVGIIFFREDGPAKVLADGTEIYYMNGVKSRLDGPTVISPNGHQEFWTNGKLGRKEGPAIVYEDGGTDWIYQGLYHRTGAPAREFANGTKVYFHEGREIQAETDKEFVRKVRLINLI